MGFLDRFSMKVSKEVSEITFPNELDRYLNCIKHSLEGFEFKDSIVNKAISILKDEFTYYQNHKSSQDFKTATNKYDHDVYSKDLMNNRDHSNNTEALAYLLIFDIIFYYRYDFYGIAFTLFKKHVVETVKSLDKEKVPESFFCHHRADEFLQQEQQQQEDLAKKYLELYDEYRKVRLKLSEYENNQ